MPLKGLKIRTDKLNDLGGLSLIGVRNDEWLYMLQEETRQSLSIEGYFATDTELKAVLAGKHSFPEILNYFRAAQSVYDMALQRNREKELVVDMALVRHIHSELFRELDKSRGLFRPCGISINGAKVKPPESDVDDYVRAFLKLVPVMFEQFSTLEALARVHVLFESIHPFSDGNGRTGRILLNYLAISTGLPPIIIKGESKENRAEYYTALEKGDLGFHGGFVAPSKLQQALDKGNFEPMQKLLTESVIPQIDSLIVSMTSTKESLMPLGELVAHFNVQESTLRQWVQRGQLIAVKQKGKLLSSPSLSLRK